jgi:hypothetical protein
MSRDDGEKDESGYWQGYEEGWENKNRRETFGNRHYDDSFGDGFEEGQRDRKAHGTGPRGGCCIVFAAMLGIAGLGLYITNIII